MIAAALRAVDMRLKRVEFGERFVRRNPLLYGAAQKRIARLLHAPLSDRIEFTERRLRIILHAAAKARYGRRLGAASVSQWPLLDKESVRDDPQAFVAARGWLLTRANTGGTTGTPLKLVRSPESVVVEQACIDRMIRQLGAEPATARIAVLRGNDVKPVSDRSPPFWIYALGGRHLILSSNHLNEATLPYYRRELEAFGPDVFWVYPTALESLCRLLVRARLTLAVPAVLSSSEMLPPQVWSLAQSVLGCRIVDYYGQAERVAFAWASRAGEYLFLPGYAFVELIPRSADAGMQEFEIVGTSLWNAAMPLVRYRTGDLIRAPADCSERDLLEIANGLRPFDGVIGRSHDVLLAPGGEVLTGIDHIARGVDHVLRVQIEQGALDRVTMRVLAGPGFADAQRRQLIENARKKIPASMRFDIEVVEQLSRTARGKTPFVIHAPDVQAAFHASGLVGQ